MGEQDSTRVPGKIEKIPVRDYLPRHNILVPSLWALRAVHTSDIESQ